VKRLSGWGGSRRRRFKHKVDSRRLDDPILPIYFDFSPSFTNIFNKDDFQLFIARGGFGDSLGDLGEIHFQCLVEDFPELPLVETLSRSESRDQVISPLRLIVWHHVTSISHQNFNEISCFVNETGDVFADLPDVAGSLLVVLGVAEGKLLEVVDGEWIGDDDVELSVVDTYSVMGEEITQVGSDGVHHVKLQMLFDFVFVAIEAVERQVSDVNRFSDVRSLEESAHWSVSAIVFLLQVVEVSGETSHVLEERSRWQLIHVDELVKHVEGAFEILLVDAVATLLLVSMEGVSSIGVDQAKLVEIVAVIELVDRIAQTVANRNALEVDLQLGTAVLLVDRVGSSWHVLSSVALTSDVEFVLLEGGEKREELLEAVVEIPTDFHFILHISLVFINERESSSNRVIDVEEIVSQMP
jgi:hypothetical protein